MSAEDLAGTFPIGQMSTAVTNKKERHEALPPYRIFARVRAKPALARHCIDGHLR